MVRFRVPVLSRKKYNSLRLIRALFIHDFFHFFQPCLLCYKLFFLCLPSFTPHIFLRLFRPWHFSRFIAYLFQTKLFSSCFFHCVLIYPSIHPSICMSTYLSTYLDLLRPSACLLSFYIYFYPPHTELWLHTSNFRRARHMQFLMSQFCEARNVTTIRLVSVSVFDEVIICSVCKILQGWLNKERWKGGRHVNECDK